jgi:hypothetical protein
MDPEALVRDARRRGEAASRRARLALGVAGSEDREVERINRDTRALKKFLEFFKAHPRYCAGTLVLPSGKRHQIGGAKRMERRPRKGLR